MLSNIAMHDATRQLQNILASEHEGLFALAKERFEEGQHLYGDQWKHKPITDLMVDVREELADALVYLVMIQERYRSSEHHHTGSPGHKTLADSMTCRSEVLSGACVNPE